MCEPSTWPPPPSTPEPLSAHDDYLTVCVRNTPLTPPLSRLRLVKDLRQETGQDLRSCMAVVNSFCDRHAILLPLGSLWTRVGCLLPSIMFAMIAAMTISQVTLQRRHDAAITHLERVAVTAESWQLDFIFLGVYLAATGVSVILTFWRSKRMREQAAEARAKFAL